jgi:hopanoid biosynthesis associated RND transporter like protein HpnN
MPALLGRVRLRPASRPARDAAQRPSPTVRWRRPILMAAVAGGAVALVLAARVRFDANPLNLQDPTLEAVSTFRELLETSETPPWSMHVLERDADSARRVALELRALPTVEKAVWLGDFVPDGQGEKLDVLSDLQLTLGPDFGAGSGTARDGDEASAGTPDGALAELEGELDAWTGSPAGADDVLARRLATSLGELRATLDARGPEGAAALVGRLEHSLLDTLPVNLERLSAALSTEGLAEEDLPHEFVERWVNPAGTYRVEVFAGNDLDEPVALDEFVNEVRGVASDATGAPRMIVESGRAVVRAFVQAFLASLAATVVILLFLLRSFRDAALVLVPLLLAGLLTGATTELCGIPFNFANVIGLPLLLGIGVDSGIHIVHRVRAGGVEGAHVLRSSTARGVVLSALTTLVSFVSLALSPHRGTASMGALLTIGIVWTVLCALLVLPALLIGGRPAPGR